MRWLEIIADWLQRAAALLAAFAAGKAAQAVETERDREAARAELAERQRDIAGRPDPDVGGVADWLSGGKAPD